MGKFTQINLSRAVLFVVLGFFSFGCSMAGQIESLDSIAKSFSYGQLTGITPGTSQKTTSGGYIIQSTVGAPMGGVAITTSKNYTVQSGIQGNISSVGTLSQ